MEEKNANKLVVGTATKKLITKYLKLTTSNHKIIIILNDNLNSSLNKQIKQNKKAQPHINSYKIDILIIFHQKMSIIIKKALMHPIDYIIKII